MNYWKNAVSSLILDKTIDTKYTQNIIMWTSGFQNPLVHADFNMFVDEKTNVYEIHVRWRNGSCYDPDIDSIVSEVVYRKEIYTIEEDMLNYANSKLGRYWLSRSIYT